MTELFCKRKEINKFTVDYKLDLMYSEFYARHPLTFLRMGSMEI